MPALQVRDFPDELYAQLKESAKRNHRSIAQQTVAFVEQGLARQEAFRRAYNNPAEAADIYIPPNVKEASERARFVRLFANTALESEPEEVLAARRAKRRKLREQVAELRSTWKGPQPTVEEIAHMIREDRDSRTDSIMKNVERYLDARKGDKQ